MSKSLSFLVDTNVWLDNYLGFRPHSAASRTFLDTAANHGCSLFHAATSEKDVYYFTAELAKKHIRRSGGQVTEENARAVNAIAWANIENMEELSTVAGLDLADFWLARKLSSLNPDLEDNLIMAVAERVKANCIVTRDRGLLAKSTVAALTPEDATALIQALSS